MKLYRRHKIFAPRKIFRLRRGEELCGVIVHGYPPATCFGRKKVLSHMKFAEINEKLSMISRVVHPKYRTIGLRTKLVKETLALAGTDYVETPAVIAKYNPFAEKAGMRKIAEQGPPNEALEITEILKGLDFSLQVLGSENYSVSKLKSLTFASMRLILSLQPI